MNHVQIKWKTVAIVLFVVTVIVIILYRVSVPYEQCSEEVDWSGLGDSRDMDYYCNYPYLPVSGYEGESGSDDLQLVSVHVAVRHGDRSPLHSLPNVANKPFYCHLNPPFSLKYDSLAEFSSRMAQQGHVRSNGSYAGYSLYPTEGLCGVGSLTAVGVMQHIMNGMFLRQAYVTKHKLFVPGDDSIADQVVVRATRRNRTFQSAVAFMHGFAPEVDMSKISVEKADNNTMCVQETGHQCACRTVQNDFLDSFSVGYGQRSSTIRNRPASQRIAARLGITTTDLPRLSHIFELSMAHFCHSVAVGCLGASFVRDAFDVVDEAGRLGLADVHYQRIARLKSQPLLYEIAHRMKHQLENSQSHSNVTSTAILPKFVLYSGHDSTVEPLAAAIGISNGVWPRYASRLVFELYASTTEAGGGIRVVYNGKDVTRHVTFCHQQMSVAAPHICPLSAFLEFVNDSQFCGAPGHTGYDDACKIPIR